NWRTLPSKNAYPILVVGYLAAVLATFIADPFFVKALRLITFDSYQRLEPLKSDSHFPVRIVDIDDRSLSLIGQWPWSRTRMAELLDSLKANGAAVAAFDIMFAEPDRTSLEQIARSLPENRAAELRPLLARWQPNDALFAESVKRMPS